MIECVCFTGDLYLSWILIKNGLAAPEASYAKTHTTIWACCVQITSVYDVFFVLVLMHTINVWNFKLAFCLKRLTASEGKMWMSRFSGVDQNERQRWETGMDLFKHCKSLASFLIEIITQYKWKLYSVWNSFGDKSFTVRLCSLSWYTWYSVTKVHLT